MLDSAHATRVQDKLSWLQFQRMSSLPNRPDFARVTLTECREPLADVSRYPFLAVPVYFRNGWSATKQLFARRSLLDKLARVQLAHMAPRGLKWVVYDAWRPRTVQATIYQHYWREMSRHAPDLPLPTLREQVGTYVSVPDQAGRTPPHSTGGAIDLGWWDMHRGELCDMGSAFDEFVPAAANDFFEQPGQDASIRQRRRELHQWLSEEDVIGDDAEWFHKEYGTQRWALRTGAGSAVYGEVLSCRQEGRHLRVQWAEDEDADARQKRVQQLREALDLSHPASKAATRLPTIDACLELALDAA